MPMETFDYETTMDEVVDNFNRGFSLDIPKDSQACNVGQAVIDSREKLDEIIKPLLINWRFDRIGLCTKLILRLAVWELLYSEEPHNIIINEAIELAKCFSETDAYKFINGILDEAVKIIRPGYNKNLNLNLRTNKVHVLLISYAYANRRYSLIRPMCSKYTANAT